MPAGKQPPIAPRGKDAHASWFSPTIRLPLPARPARPAGRPGRGRRPAFRGRAVRAEFPHRPAWPGLPQRPAFPGTAGGLRPPPQHPHRGQPTWLLPDGWLVSRRVGCHVTTGSVSGRPVVLGDANAVTHSRERTDRRPRPQRTAIVAPLPPG